MNKKVLIICYTFPPYPGIGGRRWAKFAKYLNRQGVDVAVIAAKKSLNSRSLWEKDIQEFVNKIDFLTSHYPDILTRIPQSFLEKIRYKIALNYVKTKVKGNYFDHSSLWANTLVNQVEQKIKQGYNNVVVSCAPFASSRFVIELKNKYPEVNFILDFRDPWTDNKTSFGFTTISSKRLEIEKEVERMVVTQYDIILSVSEEMTQRFKSLSNSDNTFLTVQNGFDREDIQLVNSKDKNKKEDKLTFIYAGTLYNQAIHVFEKLCQVLKEIKETNSNIYSKLQFDFYGYAPQEFKNLAREIECICFNGEVDKETALTEIQSSQVAMLILTDDISYSFSTKFHEYVSFKTPIAVFSSGGKTGEYVQANGIGYNCTIVEMKSKIVQIFQDWETDNLVFNPEYDIQKHDIERITIEELIPLLK